MNPFYISNIRFFPGENQHDQNHLNAWMSGQYAQKAGSDPGSFWAANQKFYIGQDRIQSRFLESPLVATPDSIGPKPFGLEVVNGKAPSLGERMRFFNSRVSQVLTHELSQYSNATFPESLIHVSCTGYESPSPAQRALTRLGKTHCEVLHIYHMGCSAAVPGLRSGLGQMSLGKKTSVFHSELCGLHFSDRAFDSAEQKIVQSLFGDAYGLYDISSEPKTPCFKVVKTLEQIIPDTSELMKWQIEEPAFRMELDRQVPIVIGSHLRPFVRMLCEDKPWDSFHFAVHPGGPKILEAVAQGLELSPHQMRASQELLKTYGNLSSATLIGLWQQKLEACEKGDILVSLAFGPGLTMAGAVFEKC